MAALARAFKIEEIEDDPSVVEGATKECFDCDVDNPKAVAALMRKLKLDPCRRPNNIADMLRAACQTCGGTGQQVLAAAEIAKELKASKRTPLGDGNDDLSTRKASRRKKAVDDDDLYLEY